jgi:hypothetical protein
VILFGEAGAGAGALPNGPRIALLDRHIKINSEK